MSAVIYCPYIARAFTYFYSWNYPYQPKWTNLPQKRTCTVETILSWTCLPFNLPLIFAFFPNFSSGFVTFIIITLAISLLFAPYFPKIVIGNRKILSCINNLGVIFLTTVYCVFVKKWKKPNRWFCFSMRFLIKDSQDTFYINVKC